MKDFSRYEIAQVIADEFDLIVSDIQDDDTLESLTDGFDVIDSDGVMQEVGNDF